MNKRVLTYICLTIFAVTLPLSWLLYFRYPTLDYKQIVNSDVYQKVVDIYSSVQNRVTIYGSNNKNNSNKIKYEPKILSWGKYLINNESYELTETYSGGGSNSSTNYHTLISIDQGQTWEELIKPTEDACDKLLIIREKLVCLSFRYDEETLLRVFNDKTDFKTALLPDGVYDVEFAMVDNNDLLLIWKDLRAKWKTVDYYIPTPSAEPAPGYLGPWLVMVGRLNLETLDFQEYVIKYDSEVFP